VFVNGVQVWDSSTGHPVTPLLRLPNGFLAEFSPDGRLLTSGRDAIQIWDLRPDPRPVSDLQLLARLIAGHELDDKSTLVPSKPDAILASWTTFQPKYVPDAMASPQAVLRWHRFEANRARHREHAYAEAWHLDRLKAAERGR
jgi:WD40 repeat protein